MKESHIVIRELQPQDREPAYKLYVDVMSATLGSGLFTGWTEQRFRDLYTSESGRERMIPHLIPGPDVGAFVAINLDNNSIIGFAKAGIHDGRRWIDYIAVTPSNQNQGIGRRLYEEQLRWLDAQDPNQEHDIHLQVHIGNPAWSFHTSNGFEHIDYHQETTTGLWKETMRLPSARRRMLPPQPR